MSVDQFDHCEIFNNLPDAVCLIDVAGNIQISNNQFKNTIVKTANGVNLLADIIHAQHQEQYGTVIEKLQADFAAGNNQSLNLGVFKTLTMTKETQSFPVYRLIDWSISSLDACTFIVSGRNLTGCENKVGFGTIGSACINDAKDAACVASEHLVRKSTHPFDDMTSELIDFFQNAPIALHWLSGTGAILWANETELASLGYSADEYIGHSITEFLLPGEEVHLQEVFGNLAAGRTIHDAPFRFRAKNGDVKYLIVDSNVNFNEDGSFRHTRCFIRNDTDRRVKEEILLASNRIMKKEAEAKSTFIRHVFHEMRTPLHVLSSFLISFNPTAEDFEEMRHHTDSTLGMVDDLMFATTFEAGKLSPMIPRPAHLPSILRQVIDAVNAVEQKGGRAVEICMRVIGMTAEAEHLLADLCLSRVVYSLLSNAVRYSPANGAKVDFTITYTPVGGSNGTSDDVEKLGSKRGHDSSPEVTSKYAKGSDGKVAMSPAPHMGNYTFSFNNATVVPMDLTLVRNYFSYYYHFDSLAPGEMSVADENDSLVAFVKTSGIDMKPIAPVTSVGFGTKVEHHVSNSTSYRDLVSTKGLGLGLYTAFNMVKLMGGQLECSAPNAQSASFRFTLSLPQGPTTAVTPLVKASMVGQGLAAQVTPALPAPVPVKSDSKQIRVLVVDDSSMCQKVIVKSLKGLEFETEVASNGKEACDKLQEKPCKFDAVLMDLRMPVMDGIEATRYCREVLKLMTLPIIALTAEIGPSIRDEAIGAGASHFMNKPAKAQEIISLLRSLTRQTISSH